MAREFLARLIDIDCDFSLHDLENRRATPGSPSYRKNRFSILQTIVHYGSVIRQPARKVGLRKIEITGIALTHRGRGGTAGIVGGVLNQGTGDLKYLSFKSGCYA
ncbi:hypothetical protein LL999_03695 [Burkholderia ambifaria]|uniref:hypothetical protein n=1 Tax=Burkholderia ambifaria TaxID=152480 RepID=UPI001E4B287B|nr:hypothetical protein [Burkholderia ambifaria]UEP22075.1 hypothetical protein LL999_03695 [Burkholderia ambifaria]